MVVLGGGGLFLMSEVPLHSRKWRIRKRIVTRVVICSENYMQPYRSTSRIKQRSLLRPYRRPAPRVPSWSYLRSRPFRSLRFFELPA